MKMEMKKMKNRKRDRRCFFDNELFCIIVICSLICHVTQYLRVGLSDLPVVSLVLLVIGWMEIRGNYCVRLLHISHLLSTVVCFVVLQGILTLLEIHLLCTVSHG